jgi:hypothetical protein
MVMDIRHLRGNDDEPCDGPADAHAAVVGAAQPAEEVDLVQLVTQLAAGQDHEQARAAEDLRVLVPSDEGIEQLCAIVEDAADERRVPALHVLGFHREWLSSRSQRERVLVWLRVEEDPEAARAMIWMLRGREVLQEFLLHPMPGVAREAALGVPVTEATLEALLDALLVGRGPDIDRILTQRLTGLHVSLAAPAVQRLLDVAGNVTGEALEQVLSLLPQQPLFDLLVEGRSRPAWTADPTEEDTERLQRWHHVARLASRRLMQSPSGELVRYLVNRSAADETFARRHGAFLRAAMNNTRDAIGSEMLDDLERLTVNATDDRVERMARLLMDLSDKIAGGEAHSHVADLIEKWKSRSPELKLKIFHLQQGLG